MAGSHEIPNPGQYPTTSITGLLLGPRLYLVRARVCSPPRVRPRATSSHPSLSGGPIPRFAVTNIFKLGLAARLLPHLPTGEFRPNRIKSEFTPKLGKPAHSTHAAPPLRRNGRQADLDNNLFLDPPTTSAVTVSPLGHLQGSELWKRRPSSATVRLHRLAAQVPCHHLELHSEMAFPHESSYMNMLKFMASMEPKSNTESLHGNLTMNTLFFTVPIIFYITPKSSTANSDDDPGDDILGLLCVLLPFIRNYLWMLLSDKGRFKGLDICYMENGVTVVIAYAFLLKISFQYYILAPFPISLVTFIAHLRNKILVKQQHGSGPEDKDGKKSEELVGAPTDSSRSNDGSVQDRMQIGELERTVAIPFLMLLTIAIYGDSSPVLSHFLLFSCCALGTLALLYSRLADEVKSPALKPALECIQMAYIVMLFITSHTVAAECLGEVMALVCMPELIAGLIWFSTLLHNDTTNRAVNMVSSDKDGISADVSDVTEVPCTEKEQVSANNFKGSILDGSMFIPLGGAVLAGLITSTNAYEGGLLASWNTKATVACGIAGFMPYLSLWMISRWPGSIPSSDKATQLLRLPANICLAGACLMLFALLAEKTLSYRLFGLHDLIDPSVLKYLPGIYFSTAIALFVKYLAGA